MFRLIRSVIFRAPPLRRFRYTREDEAENITLQNRMDDIQKPALGREADTCLPGLLLRAGVLIAGQLVQKDLSGLLEPNAVPGDIAGSLIAVPDKALPIQSRVHIPVAIAYTYLTGWLP